MSTDPWVSQREAARQAGVTVDLARRRLIAARVAKDEGGRVRLSEALAAIRAPTAREEQAGEAGEGGGAKKRYEAARARKETARAELAELQAAHARGDYVLRAEVEREARRLAGAVRGALLTLPQRVALLVTAAVEGGAGAPRVQAILEDATNDVIAALQSQFLEGEET